jgi:hypothetical protein
MRMKKTEIAYYLLAILNGVFMVAYGGYDDSPGAQLLGALLVVFTVVAIVKKIRK